MNSFPWRRYDPIERLLARAERSIAMLSRCRPTNALAEEARLLAAWGSGRKAQPRFRYARVPDLSPLRRELDVACEQLDQHPISQLYLARTRELILETKIVENIGTQKLRALSARRFAAGTEDLPAVLALANEWTNLRDPGPVPVFDSEDEACGSSLIAQVRGLVERLGLPISVKLTTELTAAAATGERTIFVARGRQLSAEAASRIAHHEVFGHALPRLRAASEPLGLFAVGSARGNDEQEGYAVWLEGQAKLMSNARKRELAFRHWAASAVQQGADFADTVQTLSARGAELALGLSIAARTHRAGGLAREVVYLTGFVRVCRAAEADPVVVRWLERGRISLEAIQVLRANSPTAARSS